MTVAQKKVLAEIQKTRLNLEKEMMSDNLNNEVNYDLLRMFDYLNQTDPKINFKYEE